MSGWTILSTEKRGGKGKGWGKRGKTHRSALLSSKRVRWRKKVARKLRMYTVQRLKWWVVSEELKSCFFRSQQKCRKLQLTLGKPLHPKEYSFDLNLNESEASLKLMVSRTVPRWTEKYMPRKWQILNANQKNSATLLKMVFFFLL